MSFRRRLLIKLFGLGIGLLPSAAQACKLFSIAFVSPGTGFTVYVGQKVNLQFQVNQCGSNSPFTSGSVVAKPGNSDPIILSHQGSGLWQAYWTPTMASNDIVDVTVLVGSVLGLDGNQWGGMITPPPPPLTFDRSVVPFQTTAGGTPTSQTVNVFNNGTEPQSLAVQANGGSWISVSPSTISIPGGGSAAINVKVDPSGLSPGGLSGTIVAGSASALISVAVAAPASPPVLTLDFYNLSLTMTPGDPTLFRTLNLTNANPVSSSFVVQSSAPWMTVTPGSSTIAASASQPLKIAVTPDLLSPGQYSGYITVFSASSAGAVGVQVSVALTVLAPVAQSALGLDSSALSFSFTAGGAAATQTNHLSNPNFVDVSFSSSSNASWLSSLPTAGTVPAGGTLAITTQADPAGLLVGTYSGVLKIIDSTGAALMVSVSLVVTPAPGVGGNGRCVPTSLVVAIVSPATGAAVPLGAPSTIRVQALDNCAGALGSQATVEANFSNGDPPLRLTGIGNNFFAGTWTPTRGDPLQAVTIAATAAEPATGAGILSGQSSIAVILGQPTGAPQLAAVVGAAAPTASPNLVSPGELVSVFGSLLADCTMQPGLPLPIEACGVQLTLGGSTPLPLLYVSPGQINAQIPFDVPVNIQVQLVAQRDTTLSVPLPIIIASAQPGVFAANAAGTGQAIVVNYATGKIADANSPVSAGGIIVVYCAGLGAVNPAVPGGAPVSTISSTTNPVTLTVGSQPAKVSFAGLTPGFVGLYQINAIVPAGVTPGNAVPVVIQVAGQTSPPVAIVVQ